MKAKKTVKSSKTARKNPPARTGSKPPPKTKAVKTQETRNALTAAEETAFDSFLHHTEVGGPLPAESHAAGATESVEGAVRSMMNLGQDLITAQSRCAANTLLSLVNLSASKTPKELTENAAALWNASVNGCQDVLHIELDACKNLMDAWWPAPSAAQSGMKSLQTAFRHE